MHSESLLNEYESLRSPRRISNRSRVELPPSLYGLLHEELPILKGSVIAEPGQDPDSLVMSRLQTGRRVQGGKTFSHQATSSSPRPGPVTPSPPLTQTPFHLKSLSRVASPATRPPDGMVTGSMMEMDHVPRARLLVRPSPQATQPMSMMQLPSEVSSQAWTVPAELTRLTHSTGQHSQVNMESPSWICRPPAAHPRHPTSSHHETLMGYSTEAREPLPNPPFYYHPSMNGANFDVSRLASLRYQQIGDPIHSASYFEYEKYNATQYRQTPSYSAMMHSSVDPGTFGQQTQDPFTAFQHNPFYPTREMTSDGTGMMIPTPRFYMGQTQYGNGPREIQSARSDPSLETPSSPQHNTHSHTLEKEAAIISHFTDEIVNSEFEEPEPLKTETVRRKTATSQKQTAPVRKSRRLKNKRPVKKQLTGNLSSPPSGDLKECQTRTIYDQFMNQELEDGTSDASCLLYVPQLSDRLIQPLEWENKSLNNGKISEEDAVSEVYGLLESAGLEALPMENSFVPESCPILPPVADQAPSTADDILELAFCCYGRAIASAEELQEVMRSWLSLAANGPSKNPSLHLWKGLDLAKAFCDNTKGKERIITSLQKYINRFQPSTINDKGETTWECINLGFFEKFKAAAESQSHPLSTTQLDPLSEKRRLFLVGESAGVHDNMKRKDGWCQNDKKCSERGKKSRKVTNRRSTVSKAV